MRVQKIEGWTIRACPSSEQPSQKNRDSNTLDITYFATDHNEEEILNPIIENTDLQDLRLKKTRSFWTVLQRG